jgi:hypothetical protein
VDLGHGLTSTPVTSSWDATQQLLAEQQRKDAEWRKADKIAALNRELSDVWNDIKRLSDQLTGIDSETTLPADIRMQVSLEHEQTCRANSNWLTAGFCGNYNSLTEGWDVKAQTRWDVRKAEQKRPILVSLSERDARQRELIGNLRELGATVSPVMVPR